MYANGIMISNSKKYLYVVQCTGKLISIYEIQSSSDSFPLYPLFDVPVEFFPDNIQIVSGCDDQIIIRGHPSSLSFALHAFSENFSRISSSIVVSIDLNYQEKSGVVKKLFEDDGKVISASSFGTVEVNKETGKRQVIIGGVFADGIRICPIEEESKSSSKSGKGQEL